MNNIPQKQEKPGEIFFEILEEIKNDGVHRLYYDSDKQLLWLIRYNIVSRNPNIVFVNDTVSWYKFKENNSKIMQNKLRDLNFRTPWIPGFWKIMTEKFVRDIWEKFSWEMVHINFVSLDKKENIRAIQNLVFHVGDRCNDICLWTSGGNIENYTASLQIQW